MYTGHPASGALPDGRAKNVVRELCCSSSLFPWTHSLPLYLKVFSFQPGTTRPADAFPNITTNKRRKRKVILNPVWNGHCWLRIDRESETIETSKGDDRYL